jgi:hypothetical protein
MRLANQQASSTDGQLRVVGDHLGSTILVIDTSSTLQVIHRQFYKPYGEVALSCDSRFSNVELGHKLVTISQNLIALDSIKSIQSSTKWHQTTAKNTSFCSPTFGTG